jgi:hypothetical protein
MAKGPGRCVYCLRDVPRITVDHVIPRSWFPNSAAVKQSMWTAPCCTTCNNNYSRIEKNLLERLGLGLDPSDPVVGDIARKAARALKPSFGRNLKDSAMRAKKRQIIISEVRELAGTPLKGVLPYFGPRDGHSAETLASFKVSSAELEALGCKFIRGMIWMLMGMYLGEEYQIDCYISTEESDREFFDGFYEKMGKRYELSPGVVAVIVQSEKMPGALFRFRVWNKLVLSGSVTLKDDAGKRASSVSEATEKESSTGN